ncbi:MAG: metallophosphoesterase family protein, partial [Candidatus Solibacter sp.]|nr:metallophosphoesterase family protein [Candidatus Solibacter sp.]
MNARQQYWKRESPDRRFSCGLPGLILPLVACWLAFSPPPLPAATPAWVHRPYLQNVREDRATVMWSAKEDVASTVRYSTDSSFALAAVARVRAFQPFETGMQFTFYQYQAELTGLSPGTAYSYRVLMGADNVTPVPESDYRFRTSGQGRYSFLLFGDSGAGTPSQSEVTFRMVAEKPDFVVHVGDIAYELGTYQQFTDNYFEYYWTLMRRACFFTVPGNHEYYTPGAAPYLALHASPTETVPFPDRGRYYSFDWGNTHFVALDPNLLHPLF